MLTLIHSEIFEGYHTASICLFVNCLSLVPSPQGLFRGENEILYTDFEGSDGLVLLMSGIKEQPGYFRVYSRNVLFN